MNETTRRIMQQMNSTKIIEGPTGPKGDKGDKGSDGINGTGVLVYSTLADLQAAFPNGNTAPVWVTGENSWYYWNGPITDDTTAPTVTASPASGTYAGTQSVTLTANETATIYYTTDGSTPTQSSAVYNSTISVAATGTIKYFGKDTAGNMSAVQTASYTINVPDSTPPEAVTSLAAGTPTASTVPLTWTASIASDISKYEVSSSTDGTNFTVASANITGNSYTVTGLPANTLHTFRVVAIDTSNNRSTSNPTVQATTTASSGTVVASDDFNRADGAIGTAVVGGAWSGGGGATAPTIMSNKVGFSADSTNYPNISIAQSDNVDIEMDLVFPSVVTPGNISGIVARTNTFDEGCIWGAKSATTVGFLTTIAGASAAPANSSLTFVIGQIYRLKIEVRGNVYKGYVDGVLLQTYTDTNSAGITRTKHGFVFYNTTAPRGDNFKITSY